ncbi:LuxR C-terminal-related transcriptional regulator [Microbacterium sp. P02]|uniref:helix-turn-helix transcriptional regulator n=1 Tax=Microbacterium sp. P02 TaxID=3366260 RepID=UPI00366EAFDE
MSLNAETALRIADTPLLWTRLARAHVDGIAAGTAPSRALVVGPAGSGKSRVMRHLRRALTAQGTATSLARGESDIAAVPASTVLMIDDAHLLTPAQIAAVQSRTGDPAAAVVIATRPGPLPPTLQQIADTLERAQSAIVLGHISRSDVQVHLEERDRRMPRACVDDILALTGGMSWLVAESLSVHDSGECAGDGAHGAIGDALQDVIAHRLRALDPATRAVVEAVCTAPDDHSPSVAADDDLLGSAYAAGLLLRSGQPVPAVRAAVRATLPLDRVIALYATVAGDSAHEASVRQLLGGVRDPRVARVLQSHADAARQNDPVRARELYRSARDAGADAATVAIRQAQVEWSLGRIDAASAFLDGVAIAAEHPDHDRAADVGAAIWAARGLMPMSDAVYRSSVPRTAETSARAAIVALAVADRGALLSDAVAPPAQTMPSTLTVAMDLLTRGMRETLTGSAHEALHELVRAAEMYSASGSSDAIPELPAVIAAVAALNVGEPDVAHSVLDQAVHSGHGGAWASRRLLLWRAWVALQQERAHEVETALQAIVPESRSLDPREKLLLDALSVAIARRYHDSAALASAWRSARESLLRARFDVFSLLPLGEFVVAAARVGDVDRVRPHFTQACAQIERLGAPPLWSSHLHWAGIQQGILRARPSDLTPHARALVAAAPHNRLAAMMAQAGRVWTAVLAGSVDVEAIETAALGLGTVGLAWDGARLAGQGAARTEDRREISRLLACARQLHPRDEGRPTALEDTGPAPVSAQPRAHSDLSTRELEVAALVVQGKTYAEIGASIFISPRTAEHHIARIRRRLGATNRSDLIAKLRPVLEEAGSEERDESAAESSTSSAEPRRKRASA